MQTAKQSAIEVITGTSVGMVGSWIISFTTISLVEDPAAAASITVALCTVWSLVRGYVIRRRFNRMHRQQPPARGMYANNETR